MKTKFCTMLVVVALIMSLLTTAMAATITAEYKDGVLTWKGSDLNGIYDVYVNGEYQDSIVSAYPNGQLTKDFAGCKITVKIQGAEDSASTTIYSHKEETIPAKAPTCTEKGLTEGKKCSVCNEILVAQKEVAALGHKAEEAVTENEKAATCTEKGSYDVVVYCSVCDAEISRETKAIDALGHKAAAAVKENEKAATCTEKGSYDEVVYCSVCDAEISRTTKTIDALGHKAGEAKVENTVGATCGAAGSYDEVVYCTVCNAELSRVNKTVDALPHTAAEAVKEKEVAATCETAGSYEKVVYCSVCKKELSRETVKVDALGHKAGDAVIENKVEATCTAAGSYDEVIYCMVCEKELVRVTKKIEVLPHTEEIIPAVAPTYTETGLTEGKKCSVCGEILKAQEVVEKLEPTAKPTVKPTQKPTVDPDDADDVPKTGNSSVAVYVVCGLMMMAAAYLYASRKVRSH